MARRLTFANPNKVILEGRPRERKKTFAQLHPEIDQFLRQQKQKQKENDWHLQLEEERVKVAKMKEKVRLTF